MSFQLTLQPLGVRIDVAAGQTLLDAALRQGIYLPHACGHGLCGSCKVQLHSGEVDHGHANPFALLEEERSEGKALACCATLLCDSTVEAEIDAEPDALAIPVRDFVGTVSRIEDLTPTIKAIHLRCEPGLQFQAGQYLQLQIPGLAQPRAFSVANAPTDVRACGELELNVRQVSGGPGTSYLHQRLAVGERLHFSGPYGRFFVRKSAARPLIFMAGGSGLSSPRAMIHELLAEGHGQPITLVYGQRVQEELYYDAEFRALTRRHANFHYLPVLSHAPADSAWAGARGFVHEAAKAHFSAGFAGHQAYLCGPPPMVEACIATLMQGRLFERDIYTEKFLSAADAQGPRSPLFKRV